MARHRPGALGPSGAHSRGVPVVEWGADGRRKAGASSQSYTRVRKIAGSHLVQNAFWLATGFCACQMLMRDPMHQIDHGVVVFLLRAILRRYIETVEEPLKAAKSAYETAADKLTARLNNILGRRVDEVGRVYKGAHDTLISLSKTTRSVFEELGKNVRKTPKPHSSIRATDFRHLLLLLPLICHDLFSSEVAQHNAIPGNNYIEDPSPDIVMVCIILLKWYHLYRSNDGHDTDDLALLDRLARQFFEMCKEVFPYKNKRGWIMGTDKVHFMIHAASEIMKWGSIINGSAEVVEDGHKTWIKEQGRNTNQGDSAAKTMMNNSLQKIASMELTQAVKGRVTKFHSIYYVAVRQISCSQYASELNLLMRTDRIEDGDSPFENEDWMGTRWVDGHAVTYPLDPTRWWPHAGVLDDKPDETGGRCAS